MTNMRQTLIMKIVYSFQNQIKINVNISKLNSIQILKFAFKDNYWNRKEHDFLYETDVIAVKMIKL